MTPHLSPPETYLRSLLGAGPRNSRDVLAAMAEQQFTPKQVRRARELQGIEIERSGNGADMHSTWRLPVGAADVMLGSAIAARTTDAPAMHRAAAGMKEGERRRHQSRVSAFTARGIDALTAWQVADALVVRDSHGLRASGSCAECQCVQLRICPTTPRPVIEIHECWYRRQCTP